MPEEPPNRSGGRWSRALLESVAIVLSILLAFAIDAGWDEGQDRRAEKEILQALSAEFEGYRDRFSSRAEFYQRTAEHIVWFLDEAEFIEFAKRHRLSVVALNDAVASEAAA